jgi:putative aldouronate transport system permease protein
MSTLDTAGSNVDPETLHRSPRRSALKVTRGESIVQALLVTFFVLFSAVTVYPFLNALAYALSDPIEAMRGGLTIFSRKLTWQNFELVVQNNDVAPAFLISVARTVVGIAYHVVITTLASYALSRLTLPFIKPITIFLIIPMYLMPGLIPTYVNIYDLGLMNSFWVYILPHAFGAFNMLVMRTYFWSIPESLVESARIDGASHWRILIQIIVPLSMPIIAVIALWQGVWQWNAWFDAMLYVNNVDLHPLMMLLQRIVEQNEIPADNVDAFMGGSGRVYSPRSMQMAMLIVATVPIIIIYPFFQRYFVKGVMIGAVKG